MEEHSQSRARLQEEEAAARVRELEERFEEQAREYERERALREEAQVLIQRERKLRDLDVAAAEKSTMEQIRDKDRQAHANLKVSAQFFIRRRHWIPAQSLRDRGRRAEGCIFDMNSRVSYCSIPWLCVESGQGRVDEAAW